jgi:thiopeptide-type bacteriocin biosynthesis protein
VYAKLYTGASSADRLLTDPIGPISQALRSKGCIDRWFFIRYADPDDHLRWRLRVAGKTRPSTVQRHVERAIAWAPWKGLVHRLVFDTYEREVERYGGEVGVDAAERYFWIDSEAVIELLHEPEVRWQAAIPGVDTLLSDFGFDLDVKLQVMRTLRDRFGREFRVDSAFARQLAAKYRAVKPDLKRLLDSNVAALERRSARAREVVSSLRAGRLDVPLPVLAESYVHMHLNRLFRAEQRAHELVVYDFLCCLYESRLVRPAETTGASGRARVSVRAGPDRSR